MLFVKSTRKIEGQFVVKAIREIVKEGVTYPIKCLLNQNITGNSEISYEPCRNGSAGK